MTTLTTYDADAPDEGELVINGNPPIALFGKAGVPGNNQNSDIVTINTPASYWKNGENTLLFRHMNARGFVIDDVKVSFKGTGGTDSSENSSGKVFFHNFDNETLHTYTAKDLKTTWDSRDGIKAGAIKIVKDPDPSGSHGKVMRVFHAANSIQTRNGGAGWRTKIGKL